jgi:hypothetical protein
MIKRYNNLSLALGVPGLLLQIVGNVLAQSGAEGVMGLAGPVLALVGTALLIAGLSYYAIAKGRSGWWGLCGFLSCIGLVILALLKDHAPNG